MVMSPEHKTLLAQTVSHFQEIARQNRYAENSSIEHDISRCVVCHPELLPMDPFEIYLEVVSESVKVRRPRLDPDLIREINSDLDLLGISCRVSMGTLLSEEPESQKHWYDWIRGALDTGLGLLSIHSATSREFNLDEAESGPWNDLIDRKIREIMRHQKQGL